MITPRMFYTYIVLKLPTCNKDKFLYCAVSTLYKHFTLGYVTDILIGTSSRRPYGKHSACCNYCAKTMRIHNHTVVRGCTSENTFIFSDILRKIEVSQAPWQDSTWLSLNHPKYISHRLMFARSLYEIIKSHTSLMHWHYKTLLSNTQCTFHYQFYICIWH